MTALGIAGFAAFPLIANGVNFGLVAIYFDVVKALSLEDVRHIQGLVDQIAVATSNQRVLEQEKRARREAERANELRLRFLGMISHELRTPLQAIKGFATTLLAQDVEWDADQQRDFLQTIDTEADKLTDMIEQLLDLSRIESGTLRIEPQAQSIEAICSAARHQLDALTSAHVLNIEVADNLPLVRADAQRIEQVLINLVSNAAKYSPEGTPITVTIRQEDNLVHVSVSDEGVGIAPEDRPVVFEAFRRGSDGQSRLTKGAGLGLAICKGIVEAHGGRIWIEDRAGAGTAGTVVSFTLSMAG
jgi:two-component system sensor histidine kinase KdpD